MNTEQKEKLDHYFEISIIEKESSFYEREVRRKIMQKIDAIVDQLNDFLHPGTSFIEAHDAHHLTEEDSAVIIQTLQSFSSLQKKHVLLELDSSTEAENQFLELVLSLYEQHVVDLKTLYAHLATLYKKETISEKIHYLG